MIEHSTPDSLIVECPSDKSLTHRALIFAGLAKGRSEIHDPLFGEDCISTMECFKALGVNAMVDRPKDAKPIIVIESEGWGALRSPEAHLNFGNSGTTARLLTGVFAATPGLIVTGFGDKSLSARPMARVVEPLRKMGAVISGVNNGHLLPITIEGVQLKPASHEVDKASAQVKSALLLAALRTPGTTTIRLPEGGRNHTELLLKTLGADLCIEIDDEGFECISFNGPFEIPPRNYLIPGDPSSAAFLAVLAVLKPATGLTITNILENRTRTGFLTILRRMNVMLDMKKEPQRTDLLESTTSISIRKENLLIGVDVEAELAPTYIDEVPILAVAAMFANSESRFRGLSELRVKESDRLEMTAKLIRAAGGNARIEGDDLVVAGCTEVIKAFTFDPDGDHRLAMSAGVLARLADGPCTIINPECVNVSFPGFFKLIESI